VLLSDRSLESGVALRWWWCVVSLSLVRSFPADSVISVLLPGGEESWWCGCGAYPRASRRT
jgi:hypothetical protein